MSDMVRIRFADDESGWAVKTEKTNEVTINNIPLAPGLNYGDLVEIEENSKGQKVIKRLIAREYPHKSVVLYSRVSDAESYRQKYTERENVYEGALPGILFVASKKPLDEPELAEFNLTLDCVDVHLIVWMNYRWC